MKKMLICIMYINAIILLGDFTWYPTIVPNCQFRSLDTFCHKIRFEEILI